MCLLITILGVDPEHPVLVASNRDELRSRPASPPGLFVGERRRMLAPRDKIAGGTWIGVNDVGLFAGLTNLSAAPRPAGAPSRGTLPLLALDHESVEAASEAVAAAVERTPFAGFQLLVTDGRDARVLAHDGRRLETQRFAGGAIVISNEHRVGELEVPGLERACAADLSVELRLGVLAALLLDEGERSGHRILKTGGEYGTVSSSLIALHRDDPRALIWRFAAGPPDRTGYRSYGNLGRRLVEA